MSECLPDVSTVDIPATLEVGVDEVAMDGIGLLHFVGARGGASSMLRPRRSPVSQRRTEEQFFICAGLQERNEHGWQIYRRCEREP